MDEMTREVQNLVDVVLVMLLVAAVVLLCVTFWLGMRRILRGQWRRAFFTLNGLVVFNAWLVVMAFLSDAPFEGNPAQWIIGTIGGPAALGYALGATLGLIRTRRQTPEG